MSVRLVPLAVQDRLALRSPREQVLLALACTLGLVLGLVMLVWAPLLAERSRLAALILRDDRALAALASLPLAPNTGPADPRPVAAILTESAAAYSLPIRRLDPGDGSAELSMDAVGFDPLILWLDALEAENGLHLTRIELTRRPQPGQVAARLTVQRGTPP